MDAFAGLAVVNVGHGRREIAEAIAEQTVRLACCPATRQFSNRPYVPLVLRLAPPLCITAARVDQLVAIVADSVAELEKKLTG